MHVKNFLIVIMILASAFSTFGKAKPENWKKFNAPKVELVIEAKDHEGIKQYIKLVKQQGYKGIEDWVQHCSQVVASELYYTVQEANDRKVEKITYKLNSGGALSYKDGEAPNIEIGFDLNYLVKFIKEHGEKAAADELYGVLCHEIAHGYQLEPKNAGGYAFGTEFFGFIEGVADLTRLKTGGFNPPRQPKKGGSYTDGYNVTAFFYLWITKTINPDFLRQLNNSTRNLETWTLKAALQQILGQDADTLWQHYQQDVALYPWDNYQARTRAGFTFSKGLNFEGQALAFYNYSRRADSYTWLVNNREVKANAKGDMAWIFPSEGEQKISLIAYNKTTNESDTATETISVKGYYSEFEFSSLGGKASAQHNDSPMEESPWELFDQNANSKFLTFQTNGWVQFEASESFVLTGYALTSANDQPGRDPKKWILKASNDGVNFDVLDQKDSVKFEKRRQKISYDCNNTKAYRFYRLEMEYNHTDEYGKDILQLGDWSLNGKRKK